MLRLRRRNRCRAILRDAPNLILDEPTANVDVEAEAEVMRAIDRLTEGGGTFAHLLAEQNRYAAAPIRVDRAGSG